MPEYCQLCACLLNRGGNYAKPTVEGRSHATQHHYVAERFFGRSTNRRGEQREAVFEKDPWGVESQAGLFCYECHEELLHNPVFLPEDIDRFAKLIASRGYNESEKLVDRSKIAGRIQLLQEVIHAGLSSLLREYRAGGSSQP